MNDYMGFDAEKYFITDNIHYYKKSFDNMYKHGVITAWNWGAFFFPACWCFYRKMNIYGIAALALQILAYFSGITWKFHAVEMVFFGLFGTYLYKGYVDEAVYRVHRQMRRIIRDGGRPDYNYFADELSKRGGTDSTAAVIIFAAVMFLWLGASAFNIYDLLRRMYYVTFGY